MRDVYVYPSHPSPVTPKKVSQCGIFEGFLKYEKSVEKHSSIRTHFFAGCFGFLAIMIIPNSITETVISLKDQYFDLRGLSIYSALAVGTLRDYIRSGDLPYFKVKGKILIKKSEFDEWLEKYRYNKKHGLNNIVNSVMDGLKR